MGFSFYYNRIKKSDKIELKLIELEEMDLEDIPIPDKKTLLND